MEKEGGAPQGWGEWAEMNQQRRLQPKASLGPRRGRTLALLARSPAAKVSDSESRTLPSAWHIPAPPTPGRRTGKDMGAKASVPILSIGRVQEERT